MISPEDQAEIDGFAEFLRISGPPRPGALERLRDAGREDLIEWAFGDRGEA